MWEQLIKCWMRTLAPLYKATSGKPDAKGEIAFAISGTAVLVKIPDWLSGKVVEMSAVAAAADFTFGDASAAVTYNAVATIDGSSHAITSVNVATGRHLASGETRKFVMPSAQEGGYISVIGSGAGFFYIGLAGV